MGKMWKQCQISFSCTLKSTQMVTAAMKLKDACSWKSSYDKTRQCIKKQRHHVVDKGLYIKAIVFPIVMVWWDSWTIEGEHRRIDAFELWCWRRLFTVSWTARISNQLILKEIDSEYSLEGLMLKLKLQYFGKELTHWKISLCWERLKAKGEEGGRGWDG